MNMEQNKIFAAILVAGIVAYFAGFVAEIIYHPHMPEKNAYYIDVPENPAESGGEVIVAGPGPIDELLASADIEKGQKLARACAACHTFDNGGANKTGPHLWGIFGKEKGSEEGFAYSDAMKEIGGTWDVASLNEFLYKPKTYMPGTKMNYIGIKKDADRAAVVKWLQSLK